MPKQARQYDLPDVGPPLLSGGPQVSPGLPAVNALVERLLEQQPRDPQSPVAYRTASPLVNITEQDIADATNAGMAFSGGGLGIKAYHGSPHNFERFDTAKIGTGEGAQVYGHGLYFAEQEAVAKSYRDALARLAAEGKGHMYEVDINADPAHFLNWDKPIGPDMAAQIAARVPDYGGYARAIDPASSGESAYRGLRQMAGRPGASDVLREAGIPGIKYLDEGSRNAAPILKTSPSGDVIGSHYPPKTSNYVVFNPDVIKIMRKYGIAGAAPVGAAGALAAREENENADAL